MKSSSISTQEPVLIIELGRTEQNYWTDLWRYRELFLILAWRDLSVRYKQTVIGVVWAIVRPLLTMVVFTVIFGRVANLPSDGNAPYALLVFAAMLPWTLFATSKIWIFCERVRHKASWVTGKFLWKVGIGK